jgi:hypothetical protein
MINNMDMIYIIRMIHSINIIAVIHMTAIIFIMDMIDIIDIISIVSIICLINIILNCAKQNKPLSQSTCHADVILPSSPWSVTRPSSHRLRADVRMSPYYGPARLVDSPTKEERGPAACQSKSCNPRRNVATGHRTVAVTKPP